VGLGPSGLVLAGAAILRAGGRRAALSDVHFTRNLTLICDPPRPACARGRIRAGCARSCGAKPGPPPHRARAHDGTARLRRGADSDPACRYPTIHGIFRPGQLPIRGYTPDISSGQLAAIHQPTPLPSSRPIRPTAHTGRARANPPARRASRRPPRCAARRCEAEGPRAALPGSEDRVLAAKHGIRPLAHAGRPSRQRGDTRRAFSRVR
jgi:hypothetical protein